MQISRIKYWTKAVQGTNVEHVRIIYSEGDTEINLHESGEDARAHKDFYDKFSALSVYACRITHLDEELKTAIVVKDIKIETSADKEGNDTTVYTLLCSLKSGYANTTMCIKIQHKYVPENFGDAVEDLVKEAEEYVNGKREEPEAVQQDAFENAEDTEGFPQEELDLEETEQ